MDTAVQRLLTDKLYDKRKQGALELERIVREAVANKDNDRIGRIVEQLRNEYAYAVHQPHARNGGLIGLAAASIALGSEEVARYLQYIVPPVLAAFTDQDARVRYYACESMYNIAKVAKGEILVFFNDIFDALCKLAADSELSVKNGAELLDRLIKDIVAESAASYVSILELNEKLGRDDAGGTDGSSVDLPTAFALVKFVPLLQERIHVINPFTRAFLVSWLTLLDTIPDLELIYYLPDFLGGLFRFLGDPNRDVYVATQGLLERFLNEIKTVAKIKRSIAASRKNRQQQGAHIEASTESLTGSAKVTTDSLSAENAIEDSDSELAVAVRDELEGDWIPGQDIQIDYDRILDTLLQFVDTTTRSSTDPSRPDSASREKEQEIGIVALRWIDSFFEISPEDILKFVPRLLAQVLPALSASSDQVRTAASRVNRSLMDYIVTFEDESAVGEQAPGTTLAATTVPTPPANQLLDLAKAADVLDRRASAPTVVSTPALRTEPAEKDKDMPREENEKPPRSTQSSSPKPGVDLDYAATVNALTLQFLNDHEATRVAAMSWLIMLHRKAPRKVLAFNDGTFPALLKTLSDPSEAVVTRDLQLLSQISRHSEDGYFTSFMVNLLQLFSTDRKLLEIRGNLIIRQLSLNLVPERIYRTLAECLEKDEDVEFASIMVQNLNNNLITAPELADLRKRLRNLDTKDGQIFFVALFKSWCQNAVATFSLCLLAQAYEPAYHLLQVFAELEMTVQMLIQIDKLVQLLESPVFTYLRLQLLEPERYPYLYKCLYGLLMLLPQSSAFAALKNRLNSVSAIGLLHSPTPNSALASSGNISGIGARGNPSPLAHVSTTTTHGSSGSGASGASGTGAGMAGGGPGGGGGVYSSRLGKPRSDPLSLSGSGGEVVVKWPELMEKFRQTQEQARRRRQLALLRRGVGGGGGYSAIGEEDEEGAEGEIRPGDENIGPLARNLLKQCLSDAGMGSQERRKIDKDLPDLTSSLASSPAGGARNTALGNAGSGYSNRSAGTVGGTRPSGNGSTSAGSPGGGGRPLSAASNRSSRLWTPGVGQPTISGPGKTGGGGGSSSGLSSGVSRRGSNNSNNSGNGSGIAADSRDLRRYHRKSKSGLSGLGRLNLGGSRRGGNGEGGGGDAGTDNRAGSGR